MQSSQQDSQKTGIAHRRPVRARYRRFRAWIDRQHPAFRHTWRIIVGVVGVTIIAVGLVMVPLPGPGWLVVFLGFGVLGAEFPAAHRVNAALKRLIARAWVWIRARGAAARAARAERARRAQPRPARYLPSGTLAE